eukprot:PhF_6_TR18679/c0_g1_i2/m.27303
MFRHRKLLCAVSPLSLCRRLKRDDCDDIDRVMDAYGQYWDHIRFRKGWAKPAFEPNDVKEHFEEAAEYVVRIRRHLDTVNPGMKMRMLDGTVQTWLQTCTAADAKDPTKLVLLLVHHSFQDATGYVEGLNKESVDSMMQILMKHRHSVKYQVEIEISEILSFVQSTPVDDNDGRWKQAVLELKHLRTVLTPSASPPKETTQQNSLKVNVNPKDDVTSPSAESKPSTVEPIEQNKRSNA